ncbi:hypothetical protein [Spongiibacter tropicus]|uniref:hypothetical protein n=1 Tax=Spongiibacter tropicus TaxID=454602 RepID=UPI0024E1BDBB|nr:hypothetical protein [Spongiibacter tropicus]
MRFLPDGPRIPSHLLSQRNEGNVIFFCGAWISRRADLPDFDGLTRTVVGKLGSEKAVEAIERGDGSDQIFNALVREFGQHEIDREIYGALKAIKAPDLPPGDLRSFKGSEWSPPASHNKL